MAHAEREKERLVTLDRFSWTNVGGTNQIGERSIITFALRIGHMIGTDSNENRNGFELDVLYSCKRTARTTHDHLSLITNVAEQQCRHFLPCGI